MCVCVVVWRRGGGCRYEQGDNGSDRLPPPPPPPWNARSLIKRGLITGGTWRGRGGWFVNAELVAVGTAEAAGQDGRPEGGQRETATGRCACVTVVEPPPAAVVRPLRVSERATASSETSSVLNSGR